jgi:hypothetical protein
MKEPRSVGRGFLALLTSLVMGLAIVLVGPAPQAAASTKCKWNGSLSVKLCGVFVTEEADGNGATHMRARKIKWTASIHERGIQIAGITIVNAASSHCYQNWYLCQDFSAKRTNFHSGLGPHVVYPGYRNKWGQITGSNNYTGTTATVKWRYGTGDWRYLRAAINEGNVTWW